MFLEIGIVVALTVLNGLLAMSELAVVSSRAARLQVMADKGSRGAAIAIRLAEEPGRFLSTVQIGITLVGVLAGAFSGATLGARLASWLEAKGLSESVADALGVGGVVVAITYLSLIIGELVPKQIALRNPEAVAARVAPAMRLLSRLASPLVLLLNASGKLVLKLLGQSGPSESTMSDEEIRTVIAEAQTAGVIEKEEQSMISGVMRFADRSARALMTPRRDVEIIDLADDRADIEQQLRVTRRSRLPVRDGEEDNIVGVVKVRDVVQAIAATGSADIRAFIEDAPVVSDNAGALDALARMRESTVHMALVFDEYGHFEGIVTTGDILEAIAGVFREEDDGGESAVVTRADGSFLVSGWMPADEFADRFGIEADPDADYDTAAGLVIDRMRRLPEVGESFAIGPWTIEVVDLDGRRIDKLLVCPAKQAS